MERMRFSDGYLDEPKAKERERPIYTDEIALLSEGEKHLYKNIKSDVDRLKEETNLRLAMKKVLGQEIPEELTSGEKTGITLIEGIAVRTALNVFKEGKVEQYERLCKITGDMKDDINVTVNTAQDLFSDIAINSDKEEL